MAGQHSHSYSSHPYPPSSASGGSQGAYVDAYPSYDYSSTSTPSLPEYQQQASPQIRFAPPSSSYHASSRSRYSSHPSSRHSVSSSEAEEQSSSHARAPVHSLYVASGQGQGAGTLSPSPLYDQSPDQQHHYSQQQQQQQQQHGDYGSPYSAPVTRASSRTDRPPQSMFARAPPSHHMTDDVTYVSTRSHHLPAGVVGASDGWAEGAPLDLPQPPKVTASSSSSSSAAARKKASSSQAPRKRVPASCTPCRKKKLRCNRSMPCSSCVERGDPEGCIWDGDAVPLFVAREETDVKELKAQVDRLQHLLDAMSESTPPVSATTSPTTRPIDAASRPVQQQYAIVQQAEVPGLELATFDLRGQDLCGALVELALKGVLSTQQSGAESFAPNGVGGEAFLDEAERFVQSSIQHDASSAGSSFVVLTPSSIAPSPPSSAPHTSSSSPSAFALNTCLLGTRPTVRQVLALVPSDDELRSAYQVYASSVHWHSAPIRLADLEQRWSLFRRAMSQPDEAQREREVDPLFVAVLLSACASGLASMTTKQAQARGFPDNRSSIVERWVHTAMLSLVAGKFMEQPSLDGIRAAVIIASLYIFMSTGDTVSAGMSLLSLAVNAVLSLDLHLDPSRPSKAQPSFADCEERRRLFWSVFSLSMSVSSGTSRTWSGFDLRQIDCKFPLDCYDAELNMDERAAKARVRSRRAADGFEETPMTVTVLRAQQSLLAKKITDKAFSVTPCSYDDVLSLDMDLIAFEKSLPPAYELPVDGANRVQFASPPTPTEMRATVIQLYLAAEFVRLHRPFLVLAAADDRYQHSREQCVKYGKRLLAINSAPGCHLDWAGHNFKVISAAVALAVELLQSPAEPDAPIIRSGIDLVLKRVEGFAGVSTICRKGSAVIRFVLSKVDDEVANSSAPRRAKRARTLRYSPESDWSRRPSLARALGGAPTAVSSRATSPEENGRRRKATRPQLVHMASDTVVPRVTATHTATKPHAPFLRLSRSRSADQAFPTLNTLDALATKGPHSAEATYAPLYAVAPPARQIAGLGSAHSRRAREMSSAASGADATLAALATFSPPDSTLRLHLPNSPYRDIQNGPATASTTGGFDFGELNLGGGAPSGSSDSVLDEADMQDVFSLSSVPFQGSPHAGHLGLSDEPDRAVAARGATTGGSKFNVPLSEEDFAYLHQYQT